MEGAAVTYLIVGLDRNTLARWHQNVMARDIRSATRIARTRAAAQGITLLIAAVIGPNSAVLPEPVAGSVPSSHAA
jgi:hypothetical protein